MQCCITCLNCDVDKFVCLRMCGELQKATTKNSCRFYLYRCLPKKDEEQLASEFRAQAGRVRQARFEENRNLLIPDKKVVRKNV